jgi:hypothetical protein
MQTFRTYLDSQGYLVEESDQELTRTPVIETYIYGLKQLVADQSKEFTDALESLYQHHAESIINLTTDLRYLIQGVMRSYANALEMEGKTAPDLEQILIEKFRIDAEKALAETLKNISTLIPLPLI